MMGGGAMGSLPINNRQMPQNDYPFQNVTQNMGGGAPAQGGQPGGVFAGYSGGAGSKFY